ncbi:MAG TPA: acetate--CoA ligase family protein [Bacillota bacterium]|jgi:acetyltransferase
MAYDPKLMELFFNPKSVAIIGVSRATGEGAFNILDNLVNMGYPGRLYPVNPKADQILGLKCYPSALDLPEVPDQAIITLPRELVPRAVRECGEKGIKAVVLVTQGFGEADEVGARLQEEFMAEARRAGIRLMGPNTLGTLNIFDRFSSSFMPIVRRQPLPASVICQTGFFIALDLGPTVGLGLGVDVANSADLGFYEALRYLGEDERTGLIAMHVEGIKDGRVVYDLARRITPKKPVLALKTGRSKIGAATAGSHSGSLAGEYQVYEAAFRGAGIIQLEDVDDLDDAVKAFIHLPPLRGPRVAIVTTTGGGGIMAVDACEKYGLQLAEFTGPTLAKLAEIYPTWMPPANPLDVWPAAIGKFYPQIFMDIFNAAVGDPNVDAVLAIGGSFPFPSLDVTPFLKASAESRRDKPIVWWLYGAGAEATARSAEESRRTAVYGSPERAVRALARLYQYYGKIQGRAPEGPATFADVDRAAVRRVITAAPRGAFLGAESFSVIEAYGLPAAPWRAVRTAEEAAAASAAIGYPVALKALARGLVHKSEAGVIRLDLTGEEAVTAAFAEVIRAVERVGASPEGVLVQSYLTGGQELILGAKRDAAFGPIVLFGLGGIFTEVLKDVAIGLAPLSRTEAERMVRSIRGYEVLRGVRGRPPVDLGAVVEALLRLSVLVAENEEISEIDVNPLLAFPEGQGCRAVDARIRIG